MKNLSDRILLARMQLHQYMIELKFIHTVKGDKFYFGHDVKTSCQPVEVVEEHDFSL
jgi:hypothetical protein